MTIHVSFLWLIHPGMQHKRMQDKTESPVLFSGAKLLEVVNAFRKDPSLCTAKLKERLVWFKGKAYTQPGTHIAVVTKEGKSCLQECISFLEKQPSRPPFAWNQALECSSSDHAIDRGTFGVIGHVGYDGNTLQTRVERYASAGLPYNEVLWFGAQKARGKGEIEEKMILDLIIDDGVPSRGHRLALFHDEYTLAGCAVFLHKTFGLCMCMDMAARDPKDLKLKEKEISQRLSSAGHHAEVKRLKKIQAGMKGKKQAKGVHLPALDQGTQWKDLGKCFGCLKRIRGGIVAEVMGGKYHGDCFKCQQCQCALTGQKFRAMKNKPICIPCDEQNRASRRSRKQPSNGAGAAFRSLGGNKFGMGVTRPKRQPRDKTNTTTRTTRTMRTTSWQQKILRQKVAVNKCKKEELPRKKNPPKARFGPGLVASLYAMADG